MSTAPRRDEGFIMVALLVSMAVAAVWMTVLVPKWSTQALRQKEDDLIFRGEQYARAIALYYNKNQAYPPTVDVLVTQKFLRRKWKDPITGKDFLLVPAPSPTGQQAAQPVQGPGRTGGAAPGAVGVAQGGQLMSGFMGVRSQSSATSIKLYQQQQVHNQWRFDMSDACQRMGTCNLGQQQGGPGRGGPVRGGDGRSGPPGPGGRAGEGGAPGGRSIGNAPAPPGGGRQAPPPVAPGRGRSN